MIFEAIVVDGEIVFPPKPHEFLKLAYAPDQRCAWTVGAAGGQVDATMEVLDGVKEGDGLKVTDRMGNMADFIGGGIPPRRVCPMDNNQ